MNDKIHEFGSCPLRSQQDYGKKTAKSNAVFSPTTDHIIRGLEVFKYGCCYTDGSFTTNVALMNEKDGGSIYIQSPKELWSRKAGMCHDASVFIDALLRVEGIEHKCYYVLSNEPPRYPTHSFVIARCNDGFFRIIDVFATSKCYYEEKFMSYKVACKWRYLKWVETDNGGKKAQVFCNDRMPAPKCDFMTFSERVMNTFMKLPFSEQAR